MHDIQLPDLGEPMDVAFDVDGAVVVGIRNEFTKSPDTVVRWSGPGEMEEIAAPSWFVERTEPGLVVGFQDIALLAPGGTLAKVDGVEANLRITPVAGAGGLVVPTAGEVKLIGWQGGNPAVVDAFSLGEVACGGEQRGGTRIPPADGKPLPTAPAGWCPVTAQRVAASQAGVAVATTNAVWAITLGA